LRLIQDSKSLISLFWAVGLVVSPSSGRIWLELFLELKVTLELSADLSEDSQLEESESEFSLFSEEVCDSLSEFSNEFACFFSPNSFIILTLICLGSFLLFCSGSIFFNTPIFELIGRVFS